MCSEAVAAIDAAPCCVPLPALERFNLPVIKLHRGRLPVLLRERWIAPVATEELFLHGDPERAVRDATRHVYGIEDAEFEWMDTIRYMGINHAVPPASEALNCVACHSPGGRMDWEALGYSNDPHPIEESGTSEDGTLAGVESR